MDQLVMKGFQNEIIKKAAPAVPLVKLRGAIGRLFARRSGEKKLLKKLNDESKMLLKMDPDVNIKNFRVERGAQLRREAADKSIQTHKKLVQSGKGGQGFIGKHKNKLLLGGAAGGALYYASSSNQKDEEKKKRMASLRQFNLPQRVSYG